MRRPLPWVLLATAGLVSNAVILASAPAAEPKPGGRAAEAEATDERSRSALYQEIDDQEVTITDRPRDDERGSRMPAAVELRSQNTVRTNAGGKKPLPLRELDLDDSDLTPIQDNAETGPSLGPAIPSDLPSAPKRVRTAEPGGLPLRSARIDKKKPTVLKLEPNLVPDKKVIPPTGEATDELTPELLALRDRIRGTLASYYKRKLNTRDHTHWEIMHQIVAYGVNTEIRTGGPSGELVNAIAWECWNKPCRGETFLYRSGNLPGVRKGPRVQGHEGQFLKMLAIAGVSPDYPMQIDKKLYKVADLIENEKLGCRMGIELTFKLIPLCYYLDDLDESWKNAQGESWNVERLIHEELANPILRNAACGGTHRLMGFSYAVHFRKKSGRPITGEFQRAETYLRDYHRYTFGLQNSDGSFSTEWFRIKAASASLDRRLQTTGHILEWLAFSLSDEMLTDPRTIRAVTYLTKILSDEPGRDWEIGPMGHALHALSLYERRMFKEKTASVNLSDEAGPNAAPIEAAPLETEPKDIAKTPKAEAATPKTAPQSPKVETAVPKVETAAPKADTATPKTETKPPKAETESIESEVKSAKPEPKPAVPELKPAVPEPKVEQPELNVEQEEESTNAKSPVKAGKKAIADALSVSSRRGKASLGDATDESSEKTDVPPEAATPESSEEAAPEKTKAAGDATSDSEAPSPEARLVSPASEFVRAPLEPTVRSAPRPRMRPLLHTRR